MPQSPDLTTESCERRPSARSLRALDGLNFFLADVRDGMGPFLGTFLREHHHWDAGRVGIALAASQIGTVLAQTPVGALVDRIRWKRMAIAVSAAVVAAGCALLYFVPTLPVVVLAQTAIGAAAAMFPPAVAAVTLGLVGRALMPRRTGRNFTGQLARRTRITGGCAGVVLTFLLLLGSGRGQAAAPPRPLGGEAMLDCGASDNFRARDRDGIGSDCISIRRRGTRLAPGPALGSAEALRWDGYCLQGSGTGGCRRS
jgi:MFS family permease